jgi:adenosylcobinamide-GDP ribazoletransferase
MSSPDQDTGRLATLPSWWEGILSQLRLAASFLTIVPVGPGLADNATVAASFRWFPLIGFAIGAALAVEDSLLRMLFPAMLGSVVVILSLVILTGGVHLDALADTADALGAAGNRQRALEILRDSRIGTFGAAAVFLSLALKIFALGTLHGPDRVVALLVAPGLSRWSMVAVAAGLEYLRSEGGAGATLLQRDSSSLLVSSAVAATLLLTTLSLRALLAAGVAIVLVFGARWFYQRWLGGVTGDLIGACGEVVETAVLLVFAAVV